MTTIDPDMIATLRWLDGEHTPEAEEQPTGAYVAACERLDAIGFVALDVSPRVTHAGLAYLFAWRMRHAVMTNMNHHCIGNGCRFAGCGNQMAPECETCGDEGRIHCSSKHGCADCCGGHMLHPCPACLPRTQAREAAMTPAFVLELAMSAAERASGRRPVTTATLVATIEEMGAEIARLRHLHAQVHRDATEHEAEIERLRAIVAAVASLGPRRDFSRSGHEILVCRGCGKSCPPVDVEPPHDDGCPWYVAEREGKATK